MTRIDFYHLQTQPLERALPQLLEKAYASKNMVKVKIGNELRVDFLNSLLWTYKDESFLPHGSRKDGSASLQPIWLSSEDDNPNQARFLFLVDGATIDVGQAESFDRVFNLFDGSTPEALEQARQMWRTFKNTSAELHYWQQDQEGRWKEK